HVGDSHVAGAYGQELHKILGSSSTIYTYGYEGATTKDWLEGTTRDLKGWKSGKSITDKVPWLEALVNQHRPSIVIITLGTNDISTTEGNLGKAIEGRVASLAAVAAKAGQCYWVGPPSMTRPDLAENLQKYYDLLAAQIGGKCTILNARELSDPTKLNKKKVHFTTAGGKEWAQKTAARIRSRPQPVASSVSSEPEREVPGEEEVAEIEIISSTYTKQLSDIDKAWRKISPIILDKDVVYDPSSGAFLHYETIYLNKPLSKEETTFVEPIAYKAVYGKSDFDQLFKKYGAQHGISAGLLKGISSYESGLHPLAVGPAGDVGLGQFLFSTAKSYFPANEITNCCTLEKNEGRTSCKNEKKKARAKGAKTTYVEAVGFKCTPQNDVRFNPEKAVEAMARFMKAKYDAFSIAATEEDRIKITIASYHLGTGGARKYVRRAQAAGLPVTWENVRNQMAGERKKGRKKSDVMENYVAGKSGIYGRYLQFKKELGS
ncbi:hypothetical protein CL620_05925, partial [archaeon]|nr:hypothetical protein [archaeon]